MVVIRKAVTKVLAFITAVPFQFGINYKNIEILSSFSFFNSFVFKY